MERNVYPFSAIVGQEDMKLALLLNLINPALGGVLIRGEKGTAKSTAVRGLCDLLEEIEVVKGCAFHCQPGRPPLCADCEGSECPETVRYRRRVVELPISATEDRVVGSLNIEEAIKKGKKEFEPGILAEANGNILYVDEINLLDVMEQKQPDIVEEMEKQRLNQKLYGLMESVLSLREKEVLYLRYGLPGGTELTQKEVGKRLGISRSYVSRIEKRALLRLRDAAWG